MLMMHWSNFFFLRSRGSVCVRLCVVFALRNLVDLGDTQGGRSRVSYRIGSHRGQVTGERRGRLRTARGANGNVP